ncbi:MAG: hypothetical protein QGG67_18315 [Gammaproteobacteria bacterium]|nr:hypothetical protein [Gammaproteobacteria bacterium]HJO11644.1 hypothetical protein [Gammaproteobacteria bacterium]
MKINNSLILLFCLSLLASLPGQAAEDYAIPRTEWGQPDIQGVWNFSSNVPMQRPEEFGERQFLTEDEIAATRMRRFGLGAVSNETGSTAGIEAFYNDTIWMENLNRDGNVRTSLIVYPPNGRFSPLAEGIENQPGGERDTAGKRPVRFVVGGIGRDGPEDRGLSERCIVGFNAGPPLTPSVYNNNVQIIQGKEHVVVLTEMVHDARIVKLDGRPALDESLLLWSGDSRGHWDGDTLVVVTQNFNGLTQSFDGFGTSKNKVLTERFTRVGPQTLNYEFTIDDPSTFTDKLTAIVSMTKVAAQLYEYACHEGNYGMANMLRGARRREANEVSDRVADLFRGQ